MKHLILLLFLFVSAHSICQQKTPTGNEMGIDSLIRVIKAKQIESLGKHFPAFNASFQGDSYTDQNFTNKVVFINFWFATCSPCIAEFDALNELYDKRKNDKNFEFVSFTYEPAEKIKEVREKYHIQYKIITITKQECYRLNQNTGFPANIILDKKGMITFLKAGGSSDKAAARNMIFAEIYPKLISELSSR